MSRNTTAERNAREERRTQVAAMMLAKVPYRTMATKLECGLATIQRDVDAVREEWRLRRAVASDEAVAEELAKLDLAEHGLMPDVGLGAPASVNAFVRVAQRRARLLGLDKPLVIETRLSADQEADLLARAIDATLEELGIERTRDTDEVLGRHLRLVAEEAERLAS